MKLTYDERLSTLLSTLTYATTYGDRPGVLLYGYPIPNAGIGKRGSAVEKLKGIADVLNRGMAWETYWSNDHIGVSVLGMVTLFV